MYQEWRGQTLPGILEYAARNWTRKTAVLDRETSISYGELAQRVARARNALRRAGVVFGSHVGYLMSANSRWLEVFFAALQLGAKVVPLNLTWTSLELARGIRLTDTEFLVFSPEHRGDSLIERVERLVSGEAPPTLRKLVVTHGQARTGLCESLENLLEDAGDDDESADESPAPRPDDIAMLLLTSGSTSFPKPAIHTHETILCGAASYADGLEACEDDTFLHCTPNYHVGGISTACLALMRGATLRVMEWFDPREAMRHIESDRISLMWGFDVHFMLMKRDPSYGQYDLSSITRTMAGVNPATFDEVRGMGFGHIGSLYGSTEYMGSQTFFPYRDRFDLDRMKESNGRATSGEIRIVDPEHGEWLPTGQLGEICVRGPALFKGYYSLPDDTKRCIDAEGFFHSGDLGFLDDDGYLYFRGRIKDMVKTGGENVAALEVEIFLMSEIPGVVRAVVCGTPHEKWVEAVTALLELAPGVAYTPDEIQERCRGRIAGYKIPKRVIFVRNSDWKITPTGKLDRKAAMEVACEKLGLSNG